MPRPVTPSARSTKRRSLIKTSRWAIPEARHVGKIFPVTRRVQLIRGRQTLLDRRRRREAPPCLTARFSLTAPLSLFLRSGAPCSRLRSNRRRRLTAIPAFNQVRAEAILPRLSPTSVVFSPGLTPTLLRSSPIPASPNPGRTLGRACRTLSILSTPPIPGRNLAPGSLRPILTPRSPGVTLPLRPGVTLPLRSLRPISALLHRSLPPITLLLRRNSAAVRPLPSTPTSGGCRRVFRRHSPTCRSSRAI